MVGFLCWRAGLLLVSGYGFFRVARLVVTYVDLPTQLEVGLALTLAGAAMVMASLIAERVQDARVERGELG
jgi:hypothetical protein